MTSLCVGLLLLWMWAMAPHAVHSRSVQNATAASDALAPLPDQDYSEIVFVYFRANCSIKEIPIGQVTDLLTSLDASKPNVFHFHGFNENVNSISVTVLAEAFCRRGSHNFVLGDWGKYAAGPFDSVLLNVLGAGRAIGQALNKLVQNGLPGSTLWLMGSSLGAHLAGKVAEATAFSIPRITGLDPAGPGYNVPPYPYLTAKSAEMVDVIHTDAGILGYAYDDGTVDYWPNGGTSPQPGCRPGLADLVVACSHSKPWQFLAASLAHEDAFPAVLCPSWRDFQNNACPPNATNVVYMGLPQPAANVKGRAFLITGANYPYGFGMAGTQPAP